MITNEKKPNRLKRLGKNIFSKLFGFEQGIDITDDVAVLHRRNVVIKNIIFLSNLVYSSLLFIISLSGSGETSDWFFTVMSFPVTFSINRLLKYLINLDTKDKTKQLIATYVAAMYMFLSSVLIYARLYQNDFFETASYVLLYYAIVVISLYQDKKILSTSFQGIVVIMTLIHFLWTYKVSSMAAGKTIFQFIPYFVKEDAFKDIVLRTLIFLMFYLVVYAIVSIGQYIQEERKQELLKRREVQGDFSTIVKDLFSAILIDGNIISDNKPYADQVQSLALYLAQINGFSEEEIASLNAFVSIHLRFDEIKQIALADSHYSDKMYQMLKEKTTLGAEIIKRIQLVKKADAIIRGYVEQSIRPTLIEEMSFIQPELSSQIIVMAEVYLKFRNSSTSKRPYPHSLFVEQLDQQIAKFFDPSLVERVMIFNQDLNQMYNNF